MTRLTRAADSGIMVVQDNLLFAVRKGGTMRQANNKKTRDVTAFLYERLSRDDIGILSPRLFLGFSNTKRAKNLLVFFSVFRG